MTTEKKTQDFLAKEIESWKGFEYALREENRILFHEMLNECFMVLILQQQKMINQLIKKLSRSQNETIKYYGDKAERI